MMTSPANNAATSSIRKGHTKQSKNIKKIVSKESQFLSNFSIIYLFRSILRRFQYCQCIKRI